MSIASFYLGGFEIFSVKESYSLSYAETTTTNRALNGRLVGQRSLAPAWDTVGFDMYPVVNELDLPLLERVYDLRGYVPLTLPSGQTVAVRRSGGRLGGYRENQTFTYPVEFQVSKHIDFADLGWRQLTVGANAYPNNPYAMSGVTVDPLDQGYVFASGALTEIIRTRTRPTPTLIAEVTPSSNMTIGLVYGTGTSDSIMVGVTVGSGGDITSLSHDAPVDTGGSTPGQRCFVIVAARPLGCRVEVWHGQNRVFVDTTPIFTPVPFTNLGGTVRGSGLLHNWYLMGG